MKKPEKRIKISNFDSAGSVSSDWRHGQITRIAEAHATRQELAMHTHCDEFHFYRKLSEVQETCPCWHEADPKPSCPLCYGTGYLPPYSRLGFCTHVALHAQSQVASLNMFVDTCREDRVPMWYLREGALNGRIESEWFSVAVTDGADVDVWTSLAGEEEAPFIYEFLTNTSETWRPITELMGYLSSSLKIKYRATASRESLEDNVAGFPCLNIRYRISDCPNIMGTQPQWVETADRGSTGILNLIDSGQFIAAGEQLERVEIGDFFELIGNGLRFRVVSIDNQRVNGKLIEWNLQVRKIAPGELISQIV